jgi:2-aminobenzoate-CoA ligase
MSRSAHVDTFAADHLPAVHDRPDILFTLPELAYPDRLNASAVLLDQRIQQGEGDRSCLVTDHEHWTYADLNARVDAIAHVLTRDLGLVPGNRVLLRAGNTPMLVATLLAVIKAGGIAVPTMPLLRAKELSYPLAKARIRLALCDHSLSDEMERARAGSEQPLHIVYWGDGRADGLEAHMARWMDAGPFVACDTAADDICLIAFTSGTTGEPKGTMHRHRDILAVCDTYGRHILKAMPDDRFIGSPPLAFTFGLGGLVLFPMRVGASTVFPDKVGAEDLMRAIARHRATVIFTAPTAYRAMLTKIGEHDLSSLRRCISAGETLPAATYHAWKAATGLDLMDGIGATEMLHIFIAAPLERLRPGATGLVVPGYEAKVIDAAGREQPRGTPGRLAVRGPTGCRYLADERQRRYVENGWNITGDTYVQDEDGYFWYQARSDDMIVSSGYNIAGPEVEACLLLHPAVAECGVVGAPDPERGAIVKAFVVVRPGHIASDSLRKELQEHVKAQIAPYKYPRDVAFVSTLPKTQTGKVQRFELRRLAGLSAPTRDTVS